MIPIDALVMIPCHHFGSQWWVYLHRVDHHSHERTGAVAGTPPLLISPAVVGLVAPPLFVPDASGTPLASSLVTPTSAPTFVGGADDDADRDACYQRL